MAQGQPMRQGQDVREYRGERSPRWSRRHAKEFLLRGGSLPPEDAQYVHTSSEVLNISV